MKPVNVAGLLTPVCPYCRVPAKLRTLTWIVDGKATVSRRWECPEPGCDARVGVHKDSQRGAPLGTLARAPLRLLRAECHDAFDPLWKPGPLRRFQLRTEAYVWLAQAMGLPPGRCHFAEFDEEACRRAIDAIFDLTLETISCPP